MVYSGALGKLIHEKNQKQKSRNTVPLRMENLRFLQSYNKEKSTHEVRVQCPWSMLLRCKLL
jgi:hypothetical protein